MKPRQIKIKLRILLLLLTVLAAAVFLPGCHGSKGLAEFQMPGEFDTNKKYEITFWAKNDTNKAQTDVYKKAISDFEALYPNIKVNVRLYTDYGRIYNDVITNISTGTTPNVCITYPDHIATYMTGINIVAPLDALLADPEYGAGGSALKYDAPAFDELIPEFLNECYLEGGCYALPFMRSTEALYINEDLVKALGYEVPDILTWDFVWEVSEKALEKNADGTFKINSQNVLIPFIYKSTDNMMISMLKQKDAPYSDADGNIGLFNDTTEELLLTIAGHAETGAFSTFKVSGYPGNFLNAGQCIFAVDSTAGATWMGSDAPLSDIPPEKKLHFNTLIRPVPQFDTTAPKMISQGPSICIFNKEDPEEVLASWLFAQFLLTDEVQTAYAQTEGYVPVTVRARKTKEYLDYLNAENNDPAHYRVKLDATKLLLDNTSNTFVTPVFNGSASLRDASSALVENVVKASVRHTKVDEAYIEKNFNDVRKLYKLDDLQQTHMKKEALGPMPKASVILLVSLLLIWCILLILFFMRKLKK